jgi:hypothetical protein
MSVFGKETGGIEREESDRMKRKSGSVCVCDVDSGMGPVRGVSHVWTFSIWWAAKSLDVGNADD